VPPGPVEQAWERHCFETKPVNAANRRKYTVIVVTPGWPAVPPPPAWASRARTSSVLLPGQSTPRPQHRRPERHQRCQDYWSDCGSAYRLFYDSLKGADFRSREGNLYRLAELSVNIIGERVAQGVPLAREYGDLLDTRSFGGAQVARTFYARGQTGQQLLLGELATSLVPDPATA